jgi:dihydroneopterin aldolase
VLASERQLGQPYVVDVELSVDTSSAAHSDQLTDTVDYSALAVALTETIAGEPVNLIETLAQRLADRCLADRRVREVEVRVRKPHAPVGVLVDDVQVVIRRTQGQAPGGDR